MPDRSVAELYRSYAEQESDYAQRAPLESIRRFHLASEAKWLALAARVEKPADAVTRNERLSDLNRPRRCCRPTTGSEGRDSPVQVAQDG